MLTTLLLIVLVTIDTFLLWFAHIFSYTAPLSFPEWKDSLYDSYIFYPIVFSTLLIFEAYLYKLYKSQPPKAVAIITRALQAVFLAYIFIWLFDNLAGLVPGNVGCGGFCGLEGFTYVIIIVPPIFVFSIIRLFFLKFAYQLNLKIWSWFSTKKWWFVLLAALFGMGIAGLILFDYETQGAYFHLSRDIANVVENKAAGQNNIAECDDARDTAPTACYYNFIGTNSPANPTPEELATYVSQQCAETANPSVCLTENGNRFDKLVENELTTDLPNLDIETMAGDSIFYYYVTRGTLDSTQIVNKCSSDTTLSCDIISNGDNSFAIQFSAEEIALMGVKNFEKYYLANYEPIIDKALR